MARGLGGLLALVGLLPILLTVVLRLPQSGQLIAKQTRALVTELGFRADYRISIHLWPISVGLHDIVLHSTDGGAPALQATELTVVPSFFSLLAGKPRIEEIALEAPQIRAELSGMRILNLDFEIPQPSEDDTEPFDAPFRSISISHASIDFTLIPSPEQSLPKLRARLEEMDLDLTAEPGAAGSDFDIGLIASRLAVQTSRTPEGAHVTLVDDDELCDIEARVSFSQTGQLVVRRLEAHGGLDTSGEAGSFAGCKLEEGDKRRLDVSIGHLAINLPKDGESMPAGGSAEGGASRLQANGRFGMRVPLAVVDRIPGAPRLDGWVSVDAELSYDERFTLPQAKGYFAIEGIKIGQRVVVEGAAGEFQIADDVVLVPELAVRIAHGVAKVSEVEVRPFAPGITMAAKAQVQNADFMTLLADLGVHPRPHVGWKLSSVNVLHFGGTLAPLELNGAIEVQTGPFGVFDLPADEPGRTRIIGFDSSRFRAGVRVHADALEFHSINGEVPGPEGPSQVEGGFVSIGFEDALRIDVPKVRVHLKDIGPLGSLPIGGYAEVAVRVDGEFGDPHVTGNGKIDDFVLGGLEFGSIDPVDVELNGLVLNVRDAAAKVGTSEYQVPYARLDFGGQANVDVEADVLSSQFQIDDLFRMFEIHDDPRFAQIHGKLGVNAHLRVTMGGPLDRCGTGLIEVGGTVQGRELSLMGERFAEARATFDLRWYDQLAGLRGADLRVQSFTAFKVHEPGKDPRGAVVGSLQLNKGELRGNAVLEALSLGSLDSLGPELAKEVTGSASGLLFVEGDLDKFDARLDLSVSPVRLRGTLFDASSLHVLVHQEQETPPGAHVSTRRTPICHLPMGEPFDLKRYNEERELSSGYFEVSGSLFGGQVRLNDVSMTREPAPVVKGAIRFRELDLARVLAVARPPEPGSEDGDAPSIGGALSGELLLTELRTGDLARSTASFMPEPMTVLINQQKVRAQAPAGPFLLTGDQVVVPALIVQLESGSFRGTFAARGTMSDLAGRRELNGVAELEPIDLAIVADLVPKVTRSAGRITGAVRVGGTLDAPAVNGTLELRDGELSVAGVPGAITDLSFDVIASANELRMPQLRARYAGGSVAMVARMPIRGNAAGTLESAISLRDLHLAPAAGVKTVFDADLALNGDLFEQGFQRRLPRLTGQVLLSSLEYSRPINLDLSSSFGGAKRTQVETYDPEDDLIAFDVGVRAKAPLRVRNNLADFQLALDGEGLTVTGTNQRVGLHGELRAAQGGKIRLLSNDFELRQAQIRFEDPTQINPYVDLLAVTEYRRAATTADAGAGRASGLWRISLHAYGPADDLKLDMSSEPALTQEDISLLLTVGLTKAEADSLGGNALEVLAYEAAGAASGADRAVKKVVPIDDFRFGSAYSPRTGRSEPNITVGKRLSKSVQAAVTSGFTEDRAQKATVVWALSRSTSVQAGYDNINNISSTGAGNVGFDFRWRLEFE